MSDNMKSLRCKYVSNSGVFICEGTQWIETLEGKKTNTIPFRLVEKIVIGDNSNYEAYLSGSRYQDMVAHFTFKDLLKCQVLARVDIDQWELFCEK